jgi:hypothetical protein
MEAGSTWPNPNSAFCRANARAAAFQTSRPSNERSRLGRTIATNIMQRPTGNLAEMVAVVVEAHAGGWRLRRAHGDQHLELPLLRDLIPSDHGASAAEKGSLAASTRWERPSAPAISGARPIQCLRKFKTNSGAPIATNSRIRKDCSRSTSREG